MNNYSIVTVDECQYLCEISDLCRYFNYNYDTKACFLKFGVGKIKDFNGAFGHKYSSGDKTTSVLYETVSFS